MMWIKELFLKASLKFKTQGYRMEKITWVRNGSRYCNLLSSFSSELRSWFPQDQEDTASYNRPLSPSLGIVFSQRESPHPKFCPPQDEHVSSTQCRVQPPCLDSGWLCRAIPVQFSMNRLKGFICKFLVAQTLHFPIVSSFRSLTDVELMRSPACKSPSRLCLPGEPDPRQRQRLCLSQALCLL